MTIELQRSGMRFSVDPWDPGYGASLDVEELGESSARVVADVELPEDRWPPLDPDRKVAPRAVTLFVDGVRRIDTRVWVDEPTDDTIASPALCASYAAGVVCCCAREGAHLLTFDVRRGLFTTAAHAVDINSTPQTRSGWRGSARRHRAATPRSNTRTRGHPRTCTRSRGSNGSFGSGLVTPCLLYRGLRRAGS